MRKLPNWLIITLIGSFILRIPSFFEPFYYGDEMIYLTLGQGIRKGLVLYKDLHDNKPPLLYFLASISGNVFWFRAILCFWMIATIILFWFFLKSIIKNERTAIVGTIIFAVLTSLPFLEGQVANAELFMLLPTIGACFLAWKGPNYKSAFFAGLLLSLATLFKIPSIFDIGAVVAVWMFVIKFKKSDVKVISLKIVLLLLGIAIPILLTFIWYFLRGAFQEYLVAAFLQNFGYVSSWRGTQTESVPFLTKNGPLILRGILVLFSFIVLFLMRKRRSKVFLFACAWAVTSLFAATLSERPYPHYFIQLIPSLSLLIGILFTDESIEQVLTIIPLSLIFFVPVYFNFWTYSTSLYFGRFQSLITESKSEYFNKFSPTINRNYELSRLIVQTTSNNDRIFVWGDSAAIYALSKRVPPIKYVADYHINDFSSVEETVKNLSQNPPKLIILLPESTTPSLLVKFIKSKYTQLQSVENATVWYNTIQ